MPYCTNCRSQFESFVTHCEDCDAPLVEELPPRQPPADPWSPIPPSSSNAPKALQQDLATTDSVRRRYLARPKTVAVEKWLARRRAWLVAWFLAPIVLFLSYSIVACQCEIGAAKGELLFRFNLVMAVLVLVGTIRNLRCFWVPIILLAPFLVAVLVNTIVPMRS